MLSEMEAFFILIILKQKVFRLYYICNHIKVYEKIFFFTPVCISSNGFFSAKPSMERIFFIQ